MKRFVVVFDNAPLGAAEWMKKTADALGLHFVDQDTVARALGESEAFQHALLSPQVKSFVNPHQHPGLAVHYQAALQKVAPSQERLALHGWGWLIFADTVTATVLDFSGLETERKSLEKNRALKPQQITEHVDKAKDTIREHARKRVFPDSVLELSFPASDEDKAAQATAFLKPLAG